MSKKSKTMIIALGVLVLLAAGYYAATIHSRNRAEMFFEEFLPSPTLGNLISAEIVKIETPELVLQRQDDRWELTSLNGQAAPAIELDQSAIRAMTFTLSRIWADRALEEEPEDISVYGLDNPSARVAVTDLHGNTVVYLVGDMTPFGDSYFVMQEGNPYVFVVNAFSVDLLRFGLYDIRNTNLFPNLQLGALTRMSVQSADAHIYIVPMPEPRPLHLVSIFSRFMLASPYGLSRGVSNQALEALLTPLNNRRIDEFINDSPASLSPYGLDNPVRFLLEFGETSIDLLIGNRTGTARYAKFAGSPEVFTVSGLEPIINLAPFSLLNRVLLLFDISQMAHLSITGGERPLSADFSGEGHDAVFFLNGRRAESMSFRNWFQNVIILSVDAEIPDGNFTPEAGTITFQYHLRNGEIITAAMVPFNRDFYALSQNGTMEFLIARNQVRRIFQTVDMVVFEE